MKKTIHEVLLEFFPAERIEKILLDDGYIEYRIWSLSTIPYNGKIAKFGRYCSDKLLVYPNNLDICDDDKLIRKYMLKGKQVKQNEYFTEDTKFYEDITGINDIQRYIGKSMQEMLENET